MARLSLGELDREHLQLKKLMGEVLALRIQVAKAERELKDSQFAHGILSSAHAQIRLLPADPRQVRAGRS